MAIFAKKRNFAFLSGKTPKNRHLSLELGENYHPDVVFHCESVCLSVGYLDLLPPCTL